MDSKFTKAIQPSSTKKASPKSARASCTDVRSLALKNTFKKDPYWAHLQGLDSEKAVIQYYEKRNYQILEQRVKTPFAEVDLIFKTPDGHLLMVEVKTSNVQEFQFYRISKNQKQRLLRALLFLADRYDTPVEIHWAFVTRDGAVTVIDDISAS